MENLLEILVPLIFAAVYFFSNLLSNKSEDQEDSSAPRRPPSSGGERGPAEDLAERQRQVQEAIRRKILERRAAAEEAPSAPLAAPQQASRAEPPAHSASPVVPQPVAERDYQQAIDARLQQIEASQRRAEALQRAARSKSSSAPYQPRRSGRSAARGAHSAPVRQRVRVPSTARTGLIYAEILGKPVSLRSRDSGRFDAGR